MDLFFAQTMTIGFYSFQKISSRFHIFSCILVTCKEWGLYKDFSMFALVCYVHVSPQPILHQTKTDCLEHVGNKYDKIFAQPTLTKR